MAIEKSDFDRHSHSMTEDVRSLLDALRKGNFEEPEEKILLLAAALREDSDANVEVLRSLLNAQQGVVRAAASLACKGRKEGQLLERWKKYDIFVPPLMRSLKQQWRLCNEPLGIVNLICRLTVRAIKVVLEVIFAICLSAPCLFDDRR